MTSDSREDPVAGGEVDSRTFLHQDSEPAERVEPPLLVTPGSFRVLWVGLAATIGALVVIAAVVATRVT